MGDAKENVASIFTVKEYSKHDRSYNSSLLNVEAFFRNVGSFPMDGVFIPEGRAIAQAVSRWLPTAAARVQNWV
jgi:hypothetical protein